MYQVVLDTVAVGDFLAQYFDKAGANRGTGRFVPSGRITRELARRLNRVLDVHQSDLAGIEFQQDSGSSVVISSFAFVELVRKWNEIVGARFEMLEFRGFLQQPPEWIVIDPLDESVMPAFVDVPNYVFDEDGNQLAIEWTDAVHVATAISRGENALLATSDTKLLRIPYLSGRLIELLGS